MKVKQFIAIAVAAVIAVGAYAQGTITFQNGSNAKCYATNNGSIALPGSWTNGLVTSTHGVQFALYYSLTTNVINTPGAINPGATPDALTMLAGSLTSVPGAPSFAGQFSGGTQNIPGGDNAYCVVQVRAWNNTGTYSTYEAAVASGLTTEVVGYSVPVFIQLGGGLVGPKNLSVDGTPLLSQFAIMPVPEPSIMALGALGLLGVLFIRRRK